jgi:hypothetical protein
VRPRRSQAGHTGREGRDVLTTTAGAGRKAIARFE